MNKDQLEKLYKVSRMFEDGTFFTVIDNTAIALDNGSGDKFGELRWCTSKEIWELKLFREEED